MYVNKVFQVTVNLTYQIIIYLYIYEVFVFTLKIFDGGQID